ncbi:integrase [bacterium]|nr:MAG: integrase [bacterium]
MDNAPVEIVKAENLGQVVEVWRRCEWQDAASHPALVYLASLSPGSRRTMKEALDTMAGLLTTGRCDALSLDWGEVRFQHGAALRAVLAEKYAPATANKMLAAWRGTLKAAWRLGQLSSEDYSRAADLGSVRGETLPKGRALAAGELRALLAHCANDTYKDATPRPAGIRDAAILCVLYGSGLRRSEIIGLDVNDYDAQSGAVTVRRGKGSKARITYLPTGGQTRVMRWLELRDQKGVPSEGPLFLPIHRSGKIFDERLTDQSILAMLQRRALGAGIRSFSPHDLRRTFISDLLDAGADIATVQKLAGHSNVQTTARYDRRGEVAKQKAASLLHIPED